MSVPLVSVVIPTHNRADLLGGAIESVLRQHGGPLDVCDALEVIVVDDASEDETPAIVERYGKAVAGVRNDRNQERAASRNIGARTAKGQWLAFLDSDDEWEDGKLAAQLEVVSREAGCVTACWLIDGQGGLLGLDHRGASPRREEVELFNPYHAVPSSLLIDRALFLRLGGFPEDSEVQGSEDWLFIAKLLRASSEPVCLTEPLVRYRVHAGNSTAGPQTYLRSGLAAVDWLEREGMLTQERAKLARAQKYDVAARAYVLRRELRMALRCAAMATTATPSSHRSALLRGSMRAALGAAAHRARPAWPDRSRT